MSKVKYLGYSFYICKGVGRLRVHPMSVRELEVIIREIAGRSNGMGIEERKTRLVQGIRVNYFRLADMKVLMQRLDKWLCSRTRMDVSLETMEMRSYTPQQPQKIRNT